jgi:hypothetical protein
MAEIYRLDTTDPRVGGILITFPSGARKHIRWQTEAPITPELEAAKTYSASFIAHLLENNLNADIDATNWVSVVACLQKHIGDFNAGLRAHLHGAADRVQVGTPEQ